LAEIKNDIALRNCSVEWEDNRPDFYTHALEAENVTGLKLPGFEGNPLTPIATIPLPFTD
jgi:hypothetical protein